MKKYFSHLMREISNCIFILKLSWKINKRFFFIKIPLLIMGIISSFFPLIFLRLILNEIQEGQDIKKVLLYAGGYAGVILCINLANNLLGLILDRQMKKTVYRTQEFLGNTVMQLSYSDLEQPRMKDFIEKAQSSNLFFEIINNLFSFISSTVTLIGMAAVVVTLQPVILVMIVIVVLLRLLAEKRNRKTYEKYRNIFTPIMRKIGYLNRLLGAIEFGKEVRINNMQKYILDKTMDVADNEYLYENKGQVKELAKTNSMVDIAVILQECIVYIILAHKVFFSGMPIGDFSMYMTGINSFTGCLQGIIFAFSNLRKNGEFSEDFRYCVETANKSRENKKRSISVKEINAVELEFRNVSFKYPGTDRMILKNVSLKLKKGETLSLVGVNGAGKTTFVKLICRLYEPTEGEILINGIPINTIPYEDYCEILGVVFQDFKIFAFSVAENIALSTSYDMDNVERCMEESDIMKKVDSLSFGAETFLSKEFSENGIELSGGESQKLAIARTLYKDPPLIILDEPTSALDPIAEYEIYQKFSSLVRGRTAIYISHRLSSARFTDNIAVFENGELCEYGPHQKLLKSDSGIYKKMFQMQAKYYA
ncbi:MAG: ABC transporter ATP-binding protein [Ruminococcaceae bacterium]|nr:ABC transporter ATP-binding protein [Oscillospiraceae bacterium]